MWTNTEQQLIEGVLRHGPDILENCLILDDLSQYFNRLDQERLDYPRPKNHININNWHIPKDYKNLDIKQYCISLCKSQEELDRINLELDLYQYHNMLPVLNVMKYIVDTLRKNNVVWGVGRGSSVASYTLYLIGVHKIDSIKYKLPIEEFFKGEKNG